jgi:hypothetical protein
MRRNTPVASSFSRFLYMSAFPCIGWVSIALVSLTPLAKNSYGVHIATEGNIQFVPIAFGFLTLTSLAAARLFSALPVLESFE